MLEEYELLERIGSGGMATVHRARMHGVAGYQRIVALKRLRPELARCAAYVHRFVQEARIVSMFSHPNIVTAFRLGYAQGGHYLAMECLEGWSLQLVAATARVREATVPLGVLVSLLLDLCDALEHVHAHGIVHRDISRANLFLSRTGYLKLIDFGIASPPSRHPVSEVTGKPSYMAPEVIRGEAFDERSDLFAVGVVAWELLTKQRLFEGNGPYERMHSVLTKPVAPPSLYRAGCPLILDAIVDDLLAKDLQHRTPTAATVRSQLETLVELESLEVGPWVVTDWLSRCGWLTSREHRDSCEPSTRVDVLRTNDTRARRDAIRIPVGSETLLVRDLA